MPTEPNKILLADESIARVTLDGKDWPIPKLAIKQNKVILPLLAKIGFPRFVAALETADGIDACSTILLTALQRAHPELTRADLEDMPIGSLELGMAMTAIATQTGAYRVTKPGEGDRPLAPPAESSSPTGTT